MTGAAAAVTCASEGESFRRGGTMPSLSEGAKGNPATGRMTGSAARTTLSDCRNQILSESDAELT